MWYRPLLMPKPIVKVRMYYVKSESKRNDKNGRLDTKGWFYWSSTDEFRVSSLPLNDHELSCRKGQAQMGAGFALWRKDRSSQYNGWKIYFRENERIDAMKKWIRGFTISPFQSFHWYVHNVVTSSRHYESICTKSKFVHPQYLIKAQKQTMLVFRETRSIRHVKPWPIIKLEKKNWITPWK